MGRKPKTYGASFKAKVALAALKGDKTLAQLCSEYGVHANLIGRWKKQLLEQTVEFFRSSPRSTEPDQSQLIEQLYQQIGQLTVELDWVKKSCPVRLTSQRLHRLRRFALDGNLRR